MSAVRALRGATTVDADTPALVSSRVQEVLGELLARNGLEHDDVRSTPRCLRVLLHVATERARPELHHVYLHGARELRDDLPE